MNKETLEEVRNNETKLINKIEVLEQQRKKAIEYIKNYQEEWHEYDEVVSDMRRLLEILGDN